MPRADGDGGDLRDARYVLLTQEEVAVILRCSTKTVERLRAKGFLRFVPGRPVKISQAELYDYMDKKERKCLDPALKKHGLSAVARMASTKSAGPKKISPADHERELIRAAQRIASSRRTEQNTCTC